MLLARRSPSEFAFAFSWIIEMWSETWKFWRLNNVPEFIISRPRDLWIVLLKNTFPFESFLVATRRENLLSNDTANSSSRGISGGMLR